MPQWEQTLPSIKINWHKLKEIIVLYFQTHTRHTYALCGVRSVGHTRQYAWNFKGLHQASLTQHGMRNNKTGYVRTYKRNTEAHSWNHCCRGKALIITYSGCVRQLAYNARALYCHLWSARLYNVFPHYLIKGMIFEKKLLNKKCVLIFSTTLV
jgi:hypothetical protein